MARLYVKGVGKRVLNMYRCMNIIMHQIDTVPTKNVPQILIANLNFFLHCINPLIR